MNVKFLKAREIFASTIDTVDEISEYVLGLILGMSILQIFISYKLILTFTYPNQTRVLIINFN